MIFSTLPFSEQAREVCSELSKRLVAAVLECQYCPILDAEENQVVPDWEAIFLPSGTPASADIEYFSVQEPEAQEPEQPLVRMLEEEAGHDIHLQLNLPTANYRFSLDSSGRKSGDTAVLLRPKTEKFLSGVLEMDYCRLIARSSSNCEDLRSGEDSDLLTGIPRESQCPGCEF